MPLKFNFFSKLFYSIFACGIAWGTAGCAPSVGHLEKHLNAGAFDKALSEVDGDDRMKLQLAALIIERAARKDFKTASPLISFLSSQGRSGSQALERLKAEDAPIAQLAWIALHRSSTPSANKLEKLLTNPHSDVRAAAAGTWYRKLKRAALQELIMDKDPRVRRFAVQGLNNLSEDETTAGILRDTLRLDPNAQVRSNAALAGKKLGVGALDSLRASLRDEITGVKMAAITGLAKLGTPDALAILDSISSGPMMPSTVIAAAELAKLGKDRGEKRFRAALKNQRPTIRSTALTNLGRSGLKDADDIRIELLNDTAPSVVIVAAYALHKNAKPDGPVAKALKKLWTDKGTRSDEARDLLALLHNTEALEAVKAAVKEENETKIIAIILGRVSSAKELRPLFLSLLASQQETTRIAAAKAYLTSSHS